MKPIRTPIYLDNGATSWPKPEPVYAAADAALRAAANPGRGAYRQAVEAQAHLERVRQEACALFNAPAPERIILTFNCTDALSMALKGLIDPDSRVVRGPWEHNSVTRPLDTLRKLGADVRIVDPTPDCGIDLDHLRELCRNGIDYVVMSHVSNVTGAVMPIAEIAAIAHEAGGLFIVDAAQSAGSHAIDMKAQGIDVLATAGHKGLMGPMGTGLLILREPLPLRHWREGGTGFRAEMDGQPEEYPWRLEAGTANVPGLAGLAAGMAWVRERGVEAIGAHQSALARQLAEGLQALPGVTYDGPAGGPDSGVVSFRLAAHSPAIAAGILDSGFGIALRSGLHCAPSAHRALGTLPEGTLRASFGAFNAPEDVEALLAALQAIAAL